MKDRHREIVRRQAVPWNVQSCFLFLSLQAEQSVELILAEPTPYWDFWALSSSWESLKIEAEGDLRMMAL
jgi:hypothetical protein